ncbi:exopolysaccharide biosynthesis polyprenyl glycosylphosphotransferase [Falsiroseomonas sp. HW251]|uniref:exopolysaccharide biosynthesis polyprenyl glycosylphosphotransferase n=1 Tax=Falsiroseomonas sp. HW251 TaxID=3390998 RepID=UPI003D31E53F
MSAPVAATVAPRFQHARLFSGIGLALAEVVAFILCTAVVFAARAVIWDAPPLFWGLWPVFGCWLLLRYLVSLYPSFGMPHAEELRRSVLTTLVIALAHLIALLAAEETEPYRFFGLAIWLLLIPAAYFARSFARSTLIRAGYYCMPYLVVGDGPLAEAVIREMRADPELGMVPVAVFGDAGTLATPSVHGVPVQGPFESIQRRSFPWPVSHVLIALRPDDVRREQLAGTLAESFPRVLVLSDATLLGNLWARPRPIGPYLATEVRQARFSEGQRRAKRMVDILVALPILIAAAPVIAIAAIAVKLASPGPAFFSQTREGIDGQPVKIYKLRSMVTDAEKRLAEYLASNPAARFEFERTLKLRNDPRIIPKVGRFLRRSSIDELPQLWNIVRGDMSLVGPRIMPTREVERYSPAGQALRRDVPPGLTGLWQVTSRSNSDLKIREVADAFYVSNWSVWLDAWILLRTVRVVLAGSGAY